MEFERTDNLSGAKPGRTSDAKAAAETWLSQSRLAGNTQPAGAQPESQIGAALFSGSIWERGGVPAADSGSSHGPASRYEVPKPHEPAPLMPPNLSEYRQTFFEQPPYPTTEQTTVQTPPEVLPAVEASYTERPAGSPAESRQTTADMPKSELLGLARTIKVDGVRLKDVYSAKRIDETGLRAVIEVYLRGGDVRQQLAQEIIAKEQSFERDPYLRKQHASSRLNTLMAGAGMAVKDIAGDHGAKVAESSQKTARKAGQLLAHGAKQAQNDIIDNSSIIDWIGFTAVIIVYALIILLLI